jgi:8-oxo-dGTP pyrophosphatase MutT (NUDIX family)
MFEFRGNQIPVEVAPPPKVDDFLNFPSFKYWASTLATDPTIQLNRITLQSLDYNKDAVRYAKFDADVQRNGVKINGRCLVRGPCVSVFIGLIDAATKEEYYVLVSQPRVPVGRQILEIVAGKMELSDESPRVAAIRELEEETGISNIDEGELFDLTSLALDNPEIGIYDSPGLLLEETFFFYYRAVWPLDRIQALDGQSHGEADFEQITTRVLTRKALRKATHDGKLFIALGLIDLLREDGIIS